MITVTISTQNRAEGTDVSREVIGTFAATKRGLRAAIKLYESTSDDLQGHWLNSPGAHGFCKAHIRLNGVAWESYDTESTMLADIDRAEA
jgi:hypothetical protein